MKVARQVREKYVVEAVDKALDVLECFSGAERMELNEISQRLGLNKSRTFRLLHTLSRRGYVERVEDGSRYRLGMKLFERAANVRHDLRHMAREFMLELHEHFNETVNLGVIDNGFIVYVDIVETSRPFRMYATVGSRVPAYLTSLGKAMLVHMDLTREGAAVVAGASEQQLRRLKRDLAAAMKSGYARDDQENEPGVGCIGCAILDAYGAPVAALSISGPAHRTLGNEKSIAPAIMRACLEISRKLGYGATPVRSARAGGSNGRT